jgi:hypothetical protein
VCSSDLKWLDVKDRSAENYRKLKLIAVAKDENNITIYADL